MAYALFLVFGLSATGATWIMPRYAKWMALGFATFAATFAALRGISTDYEQYVLLFDLMRSSDLEFPERLLIGKDPLFGALMAGVQAIGFGSQAVFIAAAIISIAMKQRAFTRAFGTSPLPLFVSVCLYFFLHDYTQIRAAIAIAFAYLAFIELNDGRNWHWLAYALLAVGFQVSTAIFVLLCLPKVAEFKRPGLWAVSLAVAFSAPAAALFGALAELDARIGQHVDDGATTLTPILIGAVKLTLTTLLLRLLLKNGRRSSFDNMLMQAYAFSFIGLMMFVIFRETSSALAFRVYELLDAFSVFIVAAGLLKRSGLTRTLALTYCLVGLVNQIAGGLLVPYEFMDLATLFGGDSSFP